MILLNWQQTSDRSSNQANHLGSVARLIARHASCSVLLLDSETPVPLGHWAPFRARELVPTGETTEVLLKGIRDYKIDLIALGAKGISTTDEFCWAALR